MNMRIGHGYDVHQLVDSASLVICGVAIESPVGSLGHSDGDVGYHSVCDAILGALSLGDLGTHFPSSDAKWKDADSIIFINEVMQLINNLRSILCLLVSSIYLQFSIHYFDFL